MKSAQETFDFVVDHLRKQGRPATNAVGRCRYSMVDPKGNILKCAVGCLIPDDVYYNKMEGQAIHDLLAYCAYEETPLPPEISAYAFLLSDLQAHHDAWAANREGAPFTEAFWEGIEALARKYDLQT